MPDEPAIRIDERRLLLLALCLTFAVGVIVGQLVRYQVVRHEETRMIADTLVSGSKKVPSSRGEIWDANGHLLAKDLLQWDIGASPSLIVGREQLAASLAEPLDQPAEQILAKLESRKAWVALARGIPQEAAEQILAMKESGIECAPRPLRVYPEGELASHVLGIVSDMGVGFYGVEAYYNDDLASTPGMLQVELSGDGSELPMPPLADEPAQPGTSLVLTLDLNIQYIVERQLLWALDEYKAKSGTVVVMDPQTGAILALYSYPSFDPNRLDGDNMDNLADPSVSDVYEPGSIFKVVTYASALDAGTITRNTTFHDAGYLEVGGRAIRNVERRKWGHVDMEEALVHSLNTAAAYVSTSMGKTAYYTYLQRFGFGSPTGVDLSGEVHGMLKLPGDSNWFPSELGTNSFGQGIAVTPIQMVTAAAAVANDGLLMKPYIVQEYIHQEPRGKGTRRVPVKPTVQRRAVSREAARTLTDMMVQVVEQGATRAKVRGYRVAGKTGTAEIPTAVGYDRKNTIHSFVGFAPADEPRFVVLVKLDKPKEGKWGSWTAAPTFRRIAEDLFLYMQIPPDADRVAHR